MSRVLAALAPLLLIGAGAPDARPVSDMPQWLAGDWADVRTGSSAISHWSLPLAGQMLGYARRWTGRSIGFWELARIEADEKGVLTFWVSANGKPVVAFPIEASSETSISFANAAHGYPQRIRFALEGGKLVNTISMLDGSKAQSTVLRAKKPRD